MNGTHGPVLSSDAPSENSIEADERGSSEALFSPNALDPSDPAVSFLLSRGGAQRSHSSGQLIDHLVGVESKLKMWGCREELWRAGLFHSVYGTESFRHAMASLLEREAVCAMIGAEAEALVYDFHQMKARDFLTSIPSNDGEEAPSDRQLDLLHLFVANWLEQFPRMRPLQRAAYTGQFRRILPWLNEAAQAEIEAAYEFEAPRAPNRRSIEVAPREGESAHRRIHIVDDLVPRHLNLRVTALTQRNIWRYGWKAAQTQTAYGFWHSHFAGDDEDGDASCELELTDRPLVAPVLELWRLIRETFAPGQVPVRVYANGHTYGGDGHLHTDCDRAGHFTTIFYAHADWEVNWAGETVFFDVAGQDIIHTVFPKPGRIVHFPGDIPHAARSPSRDCPALRSVIVIKSFLPDLGRAAG